MMWTQKLFSERVKALSMACLSSAAVVLCFLSGSSCSFVEVRPGQDLLLTTSIGDEIRNIEVAYISLKCDSNLLDNGPDDMVNLSQHFFHLSLGIGIATALLAWMLSVCLPPTKCSWITMAIMGSVAAVIQIPLFLVFESVPCTLHPSRQNCSFGSGSYLNFISIALWVTMTIWAQCILPPMWDTHSYSEEKERDQITIREIVIPSSSVTDTSTANDEASKSSKSSNTKQRDIEEGAEQHPSIEAQTTMSSAGDKFAPISLVAYEEFDSVSEMSSSLAGERKRSKTQGGQSQ